MVFRLRRCLLYGLAAAILCTVFSAVVLMRNDIRQSLDRKAELVVKSNKDLMKKKIEVNSPTPAAQEPVDEEITEHPQDSFAKHPKNIRKQIAKPTNLPESNIVVKPEIKQMPEETINKTDNFSKKDDTKTEEEKHLENAKKQVDLEVKTDDSVHIFYYPWYGNPTLDNGSYFHWNHPILPHWNKIEANKWPRGRHEPPDRIGSNFYPKLGTYSSRDVSVISQHMKWIKSTGVGVVVVSWYPPGVADDQGAPWDDIVPSILDSANEVGLKVTFHIEPYTGRNATNLRKNLQFIIGKYSSHAAFYYYSHLGSKRPLIYIYDSYIVADKEWQSLLKKDGALTVRGTNLDSYFVGLLVKDTDKTSAVKNGFDGVYTYFAAEGFTYGSTRRNWAAIRAFCKKNGLIFNPSVGPGYIDEQVRPWNKANVRDRHNGTYYEESFKAAIDSHADLVSITSFNEWHEGTQIEPAVPKRVPDGFQYLSYAPTAPDMYLNLTRRFVREWTKSRDSVVETQQNLAAAVVQ